MGTRLSRRRVLSGLIAAPAVLVLGQNMRIRPERALYSFRDINALFSNVIANASPISVESIDALFDHIATEFHVPVRMLLGNGLEETDADFHNRLLSSH